MRALFSLLRMAPGVQYLRAGRTSALLMFGLQPDMAEILTKKFGLSSDLWPTGPPKSSDKIWVQAVHTPQKVRILYLGSEPIVGGPIAAEFIMIQAER